MNFTKRALIYLGLFLLFGPFAVVYAFGFLGQEPPEGDGFGLWFMLSFSLMALFAFFNEALDSWKSLKGGHRVEWGCLIGFGLFAAFILHVTYKLLTKLGIL
jgi:hypothetical protein